MGSPRQPAAGLLDVARVLLLLQASMLVAATIEALIWGVIFAGAPGTPAVLSGAAAAAVLVGRARLGADRRWARRLVYGVEALTVVTLAADTALAIALAGTLPPAVAFLTRLLLPLSLIALLRRSARATATPVAPGSVAVLEGVVA